MMRLTFAGLAMATTLVFATDTPFEGIGQGYPPGPEGRGLQEIPSERFTAAEALDIILEAKQAAQSFMAECENKGRWTALCYLMKNGLLGKKNLFRQLTRRKERMDVGVLSRLGFVNLRRNPSKCKAWHPRIFSEIIKLFDTNADKYLNFSEWVALDWVLMVEETEGQAVINRYDEQGCPVFNL